MRKAEKYLHHGMKAYEKGDRPKAKKFFKASIKLKAKNEKAWLWLAKVVTSKEDRITCLKNILVINPSNIKARRSLKRLTGEFDIPEHQSDQFDISVQQESINEFSPYFDNEFHAQLDAYNKKLKFDDVWEETVPMCAFCATDISRSQYRCPKCKRHLFGSVLAEPTRTHALQVWVFLRVLIHIQLIFAYLFWYLPNQDSLVINGILSNSLLPIFGIVLIAGQLVGTIATVMLWFRKVEAFWFAVFGSLLMTLIIALFLGLSFSSIGLSFGMGYGLLYFTAVFFNIKAYPNFEQSKRKIMAEVNQAVTNVNELDRLAHGYAKLGMWGTAVQHWRQAIQLQIDHPTINGYLAQGYLQLGFKKRAADQYKKAITFSDDPKLRKALAKLHQESPKEDELSPINNGHPLPI